MRLEWRRQVRVVFQKDGARCGPLGFQDGSNHLSILLDDGSIWADVDDSLKAMCGGVVECEPGLAPKAETTG